ncbi:aminopeptidase [Acidaminobacter hydrogenoformans]|uniref:Leucyl aminopeptidase (Aminopeptidase T) n=1 Tax=Acidaminobacter hydrogenoformans DSM 2784 TaxID=1120920 RepID=A0A1G5S4G0_9FIRM|nr:aminopeptidase [Acidaminobacter hydrogenoformans]SCZ80720.1 Leucyl aminopeptidase (aminopeptidase T) [Acidaminobacter hydrogenoformans DSM 2784]
MDPRINQLAKNLVQYSCNVQPGEKVMIQSVGESPKPLVKALVREVHAAGGYPFVELKDSVLTREIVMQGKEEHFKLWEEVDLYKMRQMDAYIGITGPDNVNEMADVPSDQMRLYMEKYLSNLTNERVNNTKWVVLRYPNSAMAQLASTSLEKFESFYFDVCNLDYGKMSKAMDALVARMEKTRDVRIVGSGTDLSFSIGDIPVIKCAGENNIPDGEVFTAPVKDSVNGVISYNCPAVYNGFTYENIVLRFENGKIIDATANDTEKINQVFDTDEGARYVGEFAIGVNPYILKPMKDTLFDEKIMGSFHFTPGRAYEDASNGNASAIHWDLVCIQTPEYGGGEIYFDGELIRKDGRFVAEDLKVLNPENLK